jgi:hypothetical protein
MRSFGDESAGYNKAIPGIQGRIKFDYQILSSETADMNIAFCAIPVGKRWNGRFIEDYEINQDEQPNSRQMFIPPQHHIADNRWHQHTFPFDFRELPDLIFTIFAPRINEGLPGKGPAHVYFSNIQVFT